MTDALDWTKWEIEQINDYAKLLATNLPVFFAFTVSINAAVLGFRDKLRTYFAPILCSLGDAVLTYYHYGHTMNSFRDLGEQHAKILNVINELIPKKIQDFPNAIELSYRFPFDTWCEISFWFAFMYGAMSLAWAVLMIWQFFFGRPKWLSIKLTARQLDRLVELANSNKRKVIGEHIQKALEIHPSQMQNPPQPRQAATTT